MQSYISDEVAVPHPRASDEPFRERRGLMPAFQSVRDDDFLVRLTTGWTWGNGKVAAPSNEISCGNLRRPQKFHWFNEAVDGQGKTRRSVRSDRRRGAWSDRSERSRACALSPSTRSR